MIELVGSLAGIHVGRQIVMGQNDAFGPSRRPRCIQVQRGIPIGRSELRRRGRCEIRIVRHHDEAVVAEQCLDCPKRLVKRL